MADSIADNLVRPFGNLLLAVADDKLMLGHRNSDWTGLAPILEEDIAFSSLAQDNIAHALSLYEQVGTFWGVSADKLAFGREVGEYRCALLVEVPDNFNWASAMVRQFLCSHFEDLRLARLAASSCRSVADLCRRLQAEQRVQTEHVDGWMFRLGCGGTAESQGRMQSAVDELLPLGGTLFELVEGEAALVESGLYPRAGDSSFYNDWLARVGAVLADSGLHFRAVGLANSAVRGGRGGKHSEYFVDLLAEMCEVYRLEPEGAW